ncbi:MULTISPECIES: ketoacyl-ACP synthase III family protein [unclassified Streptomyces]|uniref:ketoacyl-ACP synthase III family protein n=1 Tax=unclassified Streptomyces TaxID=2593676 RepID=UPI0011A6B17D|nr:ketoacyl-ACP synthase III family protein [Streptomyces sp. BK340]TVZ80482.1 3-oxoacyl-[acyl-carrier-protein] synthase-3 [Streptomyces sp. BK340]
MRWNEIYVAGLGSWLPEPVAVSECVAAGECGQEWIDDFGYESVRIAREGEGEPWTAPPDMAVAAARTAHERSGLAKREYSLLLHGSTWYQGLDIWPAASYIAGHTVGTTVPALDVQQRCNVGISALDLAAAHLTAGYGNGSAVMVTTADRFGGPGADRWRLRHGNAYADGGTATVLSTRGGFARLVATATVADNGLEPMARGDEPFGPVSRAAERQVDLTARGDAHKAVSDETLTNIRFGKVMTEAKQAVLDDAGLGTDDIAYVVIPATGRIPGPFQIHHLLGVDESATTWEFARTSGHIGAGDWAAGLEHLLLTGALNPGDHVLLYGGGAGYTITTAVLEILCIPDWAARPDR